MTKTEMCLSFGTTERWGGRWKPCQIARWWNCLRESVGWTLVARSGYRRYRLWRLRLCRKTEWNRGPPSLSGDGGSFYVKQEVMMRELTVYNTLSRKKEVFKPVTPGQVKMYVCGITPYNHSHMGNARPFVTWDVIKRYLKHLGYAVTHIQNFTGCGW